MPDMSISEIESFIKRRKPARIKFDPHALLRLVQRNMNESTLIEVIKKNKIVAIEKQQFPKFKVVFEANNPEDKDINIIAKRDGKNLVVITAFPSEIVRRVK